MMTPLPKVATVHEKTVKKAQAIIDAQDAKVYSIRSGHQRRSVVHKVKVDPRVWQTALRLAGGNATLLTVVHSTEVIVHNHPQRRHLDA